MGIQFTRAGQVTTINGMESAEVFILNVVCISFKDQTMSSSVDSADYIQ